MAIKSLQHSSLTDNIFYRSMLAGNTGFSPPSEVILAEQILSTSAASVTFSGLDAYAAQGYQHLQIRGVARSDRAVTIDVVGMQLNNDTGSNYSIHRLQGNGSTVTSGGNATQPNMFVSLVPGSSAGANQFGPTVIDILDPFESTKNTTVRALNGVTSDVVLNSGAWYNTASVASVTLYPITGTNLVAGSRFTLIGLK